MRGSSLGGSRKLSQNFYFAFVGGFGTFEARVWPLGPGKFAGARHALQTALRGPLRRGSSLGGGRKLSRSFRLAFAGASGTLEARRWPFGGWHGHDLPTVGQPNVPAAHTIGQCSGDSEGGATPERSQKFSVLPRGLLLLMRLAFEGKLFLGRILRQASPILDALRHGRCTAQVQATNEPRLVRCVRIQNALVQNATWRVFQTC